VVKNLTFTFKLKIREKYMSSEKLTTTGRIANTGRSSKNKK